MLHLTLKAQQHKLAKYHINPSLYRWTGTISEERPILIFLKSLILVAIYKNLNLVHFVIAKSPANGRKDGQHGQKCQNNLYILILSKETSKQM